MFLLTYDDYIAKVESLPLRNNYESLSKVGQYYESKMGKIMQSESTLFDTSIGDGYHKKLQTEEVDVNAKERIKRGFPFNFSFGFKNAVATTTSTTVDEVSTVSANDCVSATAANTPTTTAVTEKTTTTMDTGIVDDSAHQTRPEDAATKLKEVMALVASYLPLVYKVATFIVPELLIYEVLTLAAEVATNVKHMTDNFQTTMARYTTDAEDNNLVRA